MKTIGIVGLKIDTLFGNPQQTLPGNPVRSWALFRLLENYGFITDLYIGPKAKVSSEISSLYEGRLIDSEELFLNKSRGQYDALIVCGTKLKETLWQNSWLTKVDRIPIFLGMCGNDASFNIPPDFRKNIVGATFVSPRHVHSWQRSHPNCRTGLMVHGQMPKPPAKLSSGPDVIMLGPPGVKVVGT